MLKSLVSGLSHYVHIRTCIYCSFLATLLFIALTGLFTFYFIILETLLHFRVGQYFNISPILGNRGHAIMILRAFSSVNNIACAICRNISLNIAVGYRGIECTASTMMLKPIYYMAFIIFTRNIGFIYYSKKFNAI